MPPSDHQIGFMLAEDEAMKLKISGIELQDRRGTRTVPVRFRNPEPQKRIPEGDPKQPGVSYPLITIELLSVAVDQQRNHAGPTLMLYRPDKTTMDDEEGKLLTTEYPLPVRLFYQVTTWTTSHQHDVAITSELLDPDRLPLQHGWLYVPADDTYRYTETMPVQQTNTVDEQRRRIFRRIYSVYVEAELLKTKLHELQQVTSVILDPPHWSPDHMVGIN